MEIAVIIGEIAYISRSRIMDGIVDAAKKDGANVILFTCEGFIFHNLKEFSAGEYNIFNLPTFENYDGVIIDPDSIENKKMQDYLCECIRTSNVPCVSFNREISNANEIYFDNEKGFKKLLEHLIEEHKLSDIHYISGPFGNRDAVQRLEIFKQTLKEHGLIIDDDNIYEGDFNFNSGKQVAKKYISEGRKLPQAFICANDFMAIGLMEELKATGFRIPEDVIITGYDNCSIAAFTEPRLTTVDRGEYEAGVLAYEKLINNINETESGKCNIISGKPIPAGSCGCLAVNTDKTNESRSAVELKIHMDESLDLLKGLTLGLSHMNKMSDFQHSLEKYIQKIGMESFYYCQCGSRESYYEELELLASGTRVRRNMTLYQDVVWCPFAYENGEWNSYPSYSRRLLFPPNSRRKKEGGYYIVMPVHQGDVCMGYSIIGNFDNSVSGRVLQHLVLGIDAALGNIHKNDIMSTMLAKINQKWQYDELTGLYNRSGLVNNAEKLIEKANSEHNGMCVIFFDLDGLKAVNDEKGHEAGDRYIKSMAEMLKSTADSEDIVCRYGGDEYIVISAQKSRDDSMKKLNKIMSGIAEPVSASAGCVFDHVSGMDELNRLIEEADRKMYTYKKEKKRCR